MHRTLTLVGALSIGVLFVPAEVSPLAQSASRSEATVSLLQRPASFSDALPPAVAKQIDPQEVDLTSVRLGATHGTSQIFVAQGKRGLCLIRVDDPTTGFAYTCANTVGAGGVYLDSVDRDAGTMQIADVVPDAVKTATIDGKSIDVADNVLVTGDVPIGASISLVGATSTQSVPTPAADVPSQQAAG